MQIRHFYQVICLVMLLPLLAHAQSQIESGQCTLTSGKWQLNLRTRIYLAEDPITALKSGIMLYFNYHIELSSGSWLHHHKQTMSQPFRLSYNHLTFSYQLENLRTQSEHSYTSIEEALKALGTIKNLPLINASTQQPSTIRIRFQLDTEKLPFSLRLTALTSNAWQLNSDWWICPPKENHTN